MNDVVKRILGVAEAVAASAVPGGAIVDSAVHGIVTAVQGKDEEAIWAAAEQAIQGGIQAAESIKGTEIADEAGFAAGVALLHQAEQTAKMGEALIRKSLKAAPATT